MSPVLLIILAYLLGSIPFGYLVVRARDGGDIRQTGSGGTGATNVSRRAGKLAGVLTLLLDAFKGATAVLITMWVLSNPAVSPERGASLQSSAGWWVAAAGIAAIIGHIFPVWLKFRGGKGVATGVGVFLVLVPGVVGVAALIFLGVVLMTRYVSLGSVLAALSIPVIVLFEHMFVSPQPNFASLMMVAVVGALLILFAHRENVRRLLMGTESKFR